MGMPCLPLWWIFFRFTYWLSSKGHLDSLHLLSLQWILVFFSYQDILRADSYYLGIFIGYTVIVWCVHRNMKYSYANNWLWFFFFKKISFMCLSVLSAGLYVYHRCAWCVQSPKDASDPLELDGCELLCWCWETNLCCLQEQQVLLLSPLSSPRN